MKQTTNYHLNQWDPGDRLLRTDFNGDNGKIDAAIRAAENRINSFSNQLSSTVSNVNSQISSAMSTINNKIAAVEGKVGLKLIRTLTATTTAQSVLLPLGNIDWAKYRYVHFEVVPTGDSGYVYVKLNDDDYCSIGMMNGNATGSSTNTLWCTFFPMYSASRGVGVRSISVYESKWIHLKYPCSALTSIRLECGNGSTIASGSLVRIYGEE